jgi:outer membrane protein assembly factor BamB
MFRAAAAMAVLAGSAAQAQGTFRGNDLRLGTYPPSTKPQLAGIAWRIYTGGEVIASPTIVDGVVYIGSGNGVMYAMDAATGAKRWSVSLGSAISATAAVDGGSVYVGARDGNFFALSAATGKEIWRFATGAPMELHWGHESGDYWTSSPAVRGGTVVFGGSDGNVYALSAATGKLLWKSPTEGRVHSSPAIDGDNVVIGSFDGTVRCYSLATGKERWKFATTGTTLESKNFGYDRRTVQSSPVIVNGVAVVGARDGFIYAIDVATGKEKWHYDHKISWINSSAAFMDGTLYDASSDAAFVQALDAATGTQKWRYTADAPVWSSPAATGDWLYMGDFVGRLHAISRADGKRQWLLRTGSMILSSPVPFRDLVIVGSTDGAVYGVRTSDIAVQRAVFFDSAYLKAAHVDDPGKTATYFSRRGYTQVDAATLKSWMEARIADKAPSTVVFAVDFAPEAIAGKPYAQSVFRRYLESGGKILWAGLPPALWPRDSAGGPVQSLLAIDWKASGDLLGVNVDEAIFDARGVQATAAGLAWGLTPGHYRDAWSVDVRGVTTVLAQDEWGLAAAWVKNYGGAPGTGFVKVPASDPFVMYLAAEYRP